VPDFAQTARETAERAIAEKCDVAFDAAERLVDQAIARSAKLSTADKRWIDTLHFNVDVAELTRGLSGRGSKLYYRVVLARDVAATQLATAAGVKPGTPAHTATRYLLLNPLPLEETDA